MNVSGVPQPAGHLLGLAVARMAGALRNLPNSLREQLGQSGHTRSRLTWSAMCWQVALQNHAGGWRLYAMYQYDH